MKSVNEISRISADVRYCSAGPYEGRYKDVAKRVKTGDQEAIKEAARIFSEIIPKDSVLVPIPSHLGYATYNLEICLLLKKQYGYRLLNCLRCKPHDSLCSLKNLEKESGKEKGSLLPSPEEMGFFLIWEPKGKIAFVDNVIASGTTAMAAAALLPGSTVYCIASDEKYPKIQGVNKK